MNASWIIFGAEATASVLTLATGFLIARLSSVPDFGAFSAALAYASIVAILVDAGMGMLAAKGLARGVAGPDTSLGELFTWRLGVMGGAVLLGPLAGGWLLTGAARGLAAGLLPGVLLIGLGDFFAWLFKGARQARLCAGMQIGSRGLLLAACVAGLMARRPLAGLLIAYGVTGIAAATLGWAAASRRVHRLRPERLSPFFLQRTLPELYKLGAILILSVAFSRIDLMIVVRLRGEAEAGLFSAASRIMDAARLIPMAAYSVFLPLFSALHDQPAPRRAAFRKAYAALLLAAVAIAVIGSTQAEPLLGRVLGPSYRAAAGCFRPLLWTGVMVFANILMFAFLYALNDHRTPLVGIVMAILVQTALDFWWIPRYGLASAAWARLAADGLNSGILAWGILRRRWLSVWDLLLPPLALVGTPATVLALARIGARA